MHRYKDLQIWKLAFDLSKEVYRVTREFPKEEIYGLTNQIRRASVSIFSNIAEGSGRGTDKDFRNFLFNALGSLREVEAQLLFAKDIGYLKSDNGCQISEVGSLMEDIDELGAKLSKFIYRLSEVG